MYVTPYTMLLCWGKADWDVDSHSFSVLTLPAQSMKWLIRSLSESCQVQKQTPSCCAVFEERMVYGPLVGGVKGDKERGVPKETSGDQCDGMGVDGGESLWRRMWVTPPHCTRLKNNISYGSWSPRLSDGTLLHCRRKWWGKRNSCVSQNFTLWLCSGLCGSELVKSRGVINSLKAGYDLPLQISRN